MKKRIVSVFLFTSLLLSCVLWQTPVAEAAYENIYQNTGNQAEDLIGVALTQVGYTEGKNNDTKYCDWMGYPNQPWCAMFISWCAEQADIPSSVLKPSAWASPGSGRGFNIPYHSMGSGYIPKRGDLFFTEKFEHVGIVLGVDGENFITIEGNTNNDGSDEGYGVLIRTRVIAECHFGSPNYQGGREEHTFVREVGKEHPHTIRYRCTTCSESYTTGSRTQDMTCSQCMDCKCDPKKAGWYRVSVTGMRLAVRSGHGTQHTRIGYLEDGEAVYVHAMDGEWAHITYGRRTGYIAVSYLERFMPAPWELTTSGHFYKGDEALIQWHDTYAATGYTVMVYRDNTLVESLSTSRNSFTLSEMLPGNYRVSVTATDGSYVSAASVLNFTVLDTYNLRYDAAGGSGAPGWQIRYEDKPLTLSAKVPTRNGYRFLGWVEDPGRKQADFQPGAAWEGKKDTTLYALWQENDAVAVSVKIVTPAKKLTYITGQSLDTTGLTLAVTYSDGTVVVVDKGFSCDGFDNKTPGTATVKLSCQGLQVSYTVTVLENLPGDVDENLLVDKEDVMALLWHVSFPELYPVNAITDFTGDGITDKEDVMALLWHVSFPELYPLT